MKNIINELENYIAKFTKQYATGFNPSKQKYIEKLENQILTIIEKNEKILTMTNAHGKNIGMIAAEHKLENEEHALQQDKYGWNLEMMCAHFNLIRATKLALKNKKAVEQKK